MLNLSQGDVMKLTILEDDETLVYVLNKYFKDKSFQVRTFSLLKEALNHHVEDNFYLIDVSLPDGEGYQYAKKIRETSDAPIIFLSVKGDQKSLLSGFDSGADDYLTKPFTFEELDKRMTALINRYQAKVLKMGDLKIELDKTRVSFLDEEIHLSVQEYRMLVLLVQNNNQVVSRTTFNEILNVMSDIQDNTLNVAMGRLRRKLDGLVEIEAVIKKGYRIRQL